MKTPRTTQLLLSSLLLLLGSTAAQAQDDTFAPWDVSRARSFWEANARGGGRDCLETINEAMRVLYEDPGMRLKSTVDLTMRALERLKRAEAPIVIRFLNEDGRETTGVTEPKTLSRSVWDTLIERAEGQPNGWFLFGFSPLDGYHSIILALDLQNRGDPKVYWADQWASKGGFKLYGTKEELDGEIESLTNRWWTSVFRSKGVRFKSDSKLYPLLPRRAPAEPQQATVDRLPAGLGLPLHSKPTLGSETYVRDDRGQRRDLHRGDSLPVTGRRGQWVRVRLPDGVEAWVHHYYLTIKARRDTLEASAESGISELLTASASRARTGSD